MRRLANTYEQPCAYCHREFIPVKRGTQRFCSASCRTTHCKKKKAGTLDRVTKLKGPARGGAANSFAEMALASAAGSLAANTVTQGAEYYAVTKGLVERVVQLTAQVQQLQAAQEASARRQEETATLLGRGILTLLTRSGATEAEAWAALNTPFARPTPPALPTPVPDERALPPPGLPFAPPVPKAPRPAAAARHRVPNEPSGSTRPARKESAKPAGNRAPNSDPKEPG